MNINDERSMLIERVLDIERVRGLDEALAVGAVSDYEVPGPTKKGMPRKRRAPIPGPKGVHYISNEWRDIKRFLGKLTDVELRAMADFFVKRGFKVKVKSGAKDVLIDGDDEGRRGWPEPAINKWLTASDEAFAFIRKYHDIRKGGGPSGDFHDKRRSYAIEAFYNSIVGFRKGNPKRVWEKFSPEEKLYLVIDKRLANEDGTPTSNAAREGADIRS